jgi:hypothetical protein
MPLVLGKAFVGPEGLSYGCGGGSPTASSLLLLHCQSWPLVHTAARSYWLAAHGWLHQIVI